MDRFGRMFWGFLLFLLFSANSSLFATGMSIFNVKDYDATGIKADNAQAAIQKAIDAYGKAGGGMVYLPPGEYTSGTLTCAVMCASTLKAARRFMLQKI